MADEKYTWDGKGKTTLTGGDTGESYDPNYYGPKTGGDTLEGPEAGVKLRFDTTEDGEMKSPEGEIEFTGMERVTTGAGNDTVRAGAATINPEHDGTPEHGLSIELGAGDDNIVASAFNDYVDPGAGNDTVWAGHGDDHIQSSRGDDVIYGGPGSDNIRWGQGAPDGNSGEGLAYGNDTLSGGDDEDVVNLWAYSNEGRGVQVDLTTARAGTATVDFTPTTEVATFRGFELIWTHQGADTVDGSKAWIGKDKSGARINTRWGDDIITGTRGNDIIEGGEGADTLDGGAGDDLISANGDFFRLDAPPDADPDVIVARRGCGHDTIIAFGEEDMLRIPDGISYSFDRQGDDTLLTLADGSTMLLIGVDFEPKVVGKA